jgi:hypothetical protein
MMTAFARSNSVNAGMRLLKKQALGLLFLFSALSAAAAPLDAMLTAMPEKLAQKGYLELGSDHMNQQLDFFKIRDSNALAAGTQAGDYHGAHLSGEWRVHDNAWLSGGLWQRNLNGLSETYHFNSWQAAGLYRFVDADGKIPAMAIRLSAWRNYASEIGASNICAAPVVNDPRTCQVNAFLNTVKITNPADRQLQADLIGTWKLTPAADLSVLLGLGKTQLSYGALTATTTRDGLDYQLSFIGSDIFGTTADGSTQFRDKSSKYGVDIVNELAWRGNFIQAGVNTSWRSGPWTLRGGYLFYAVKRQVVDDILAARGWSVFTQNQSIALEANYRFNSYLSAFVRSQLSSKLIFNDMPVIYNSFSSDLVGGRYSIYSAGLRADF